MTLLNAKRKGSRQERRARKILEAAGYLVTKAGGSLGLFDLIAENRQGVRHVQVKSNRLPSPVEREDMQAAKANLPTNSTIEIWIFYDGKENREPRIEYL
jgi:Holliday junction resolvase-like predicted endonuclease